MAGAAHRAPLVVDGRMFILGDDFIRCTDVYNGRVHWETPIPGIASPYSFPHYAGTYLVGSNWVRFGGGGYTVLRVAVLRVGVRA